MSPWHGVVPTKSNKRRTNLMIMKVPSLLCSFHMQSSKCLTIRKVKSSVTLFKALWTLLKATSNKEKKMKNPNMHVAKISWKSISLFHLRRECGISTVELQRLLQCKEALDSTVSEYRTCMYAYFWHKIVVLAKKIFYIYFYFLTHTRSQYTRPWTFCVTKVIISQVNCR